MGREFLSVYLFGLLVLEAFLSLWSRPEFAAQFCNDCVATSPDLIDSPTSFSGVLALPFKKYRYTLPCFQMEQEWYTHTTQRTPTKTGFIMNKPMKVGGSTAAGVTLRIAKSLAERLQNTSTVDYRVPIRRAKTDLVTSPLHLCKARFDHSPGFIMKYGERDRESSFLWSVLREPSSRWVSEFFHFQVSRPPKTEPTDANFLAYLRRTDHRNNYYLQTLSTRVYGNDATVPWPLGTRGIYDPNTTIPEGLGVTIINDILDDYDFIAVTERMSESLVALQMILGLDTSDILYLSAKRGGGYDDGGFTDTCTYVIPPFVSPGVKKWFQSEEFQELSKWDKLLYKAVDRSLDLTIDALGREVFHENLLKFREAQKLVSERCGDEVLRCSPSGEYNPVNNSCLWLDSACGTDCIDRIAATQFNASKPMTLSTSSKGTMR